jgi:hypothetical protein
MTLAGVLLFFYAPSLCGNVVFHYASGVTIGILLSLIVFTFLLQRKVAKNHFSHIRRKLAKNNISHIQ